LTTVIEEGYRECASIVRHLLLKHEFSCVFFLISNLIDNKALFYRNKVSLCIEAINSMQCDIMGAQKAIYEMCGRNFRDRDAIVQWLKGLKHTDEALIDATCELLGVDWRKYLAEAKPYLTSEEIRLLAGDGFTIGAHSRSHPHFKLLSDDDIEEQIVTSCRTVQRITGQSEVPFAFPYSAAGIRRDLLQSLKRRFEWLGIFFDCRGIGGDTALLMDRVGADRPPEPHTRGSNISLILRAAYRNSLASTTNVRPPLRIGY
jgi:peptidoglycan/xylan/chitin deacetylase (PgdA/CDA1 family)